MDIESLKVKLPKVFTYKLSLEESLEIDQVTNKIKIAGPCTIENSEMLSEIASEIKKLNIPILRGGSFKNRTSPYSFQGLELEGLQMHSRIAKEFSLKTISEIIDGSQIEQFRSIDIIQIGARGMKNYILMRELVKLNKPVLLKREMNSTIYEFLSAAEKLLCYGQKKLILCERGITIREDFYKFILDLNIVSWLKSNTNLPIIVDPSHAAGLRNLVKPLSAAAIGAGADGLMIEVHSSPKEALCDSDQALSLEMLKSFSNL